MFSQEDKIKILVVRFKRIGDSILSLPLCHSLKLTFPNAQVDFVLYEDIVPLFLNHPYIDNVISIKKDEQKNIFKYLKKVKEINKNNYDIVIDIMSTFKSEIFCLFASKAVYKIGRYKKYRGFFYTHKMKEPDSLNKIDKFIKQLLSPLEKDGFNLKISHELKFFPTIEDNKKYRKIFENSGVDFSKPVIAFSIYSRVSTKIYPIDEMKKVVQYLIDKYDAQIIFFHTPDQREAVQKIHREMQNDKNIFSNIFTPTIKDLVSLLENCDYFIGNEGGARHLAQSLDLPSLGIYHPVSDLKEWLPFPSDKNMGISPHVLLEEYSMTLEDYNKLEHENKFRLIKVEHIFKLIDQLMTNNKKRLS